MDLDKERAFWDRHLERVSQIIDDALAHDEDVDDLIRWRENIKIRIKAMQDAPIVDKPKKASFK